MGLQFIWHDVLKLCTAHTSIGSLLAACRDALTVPLLDHLKVQCSLFPPYSLGVWSKKERKRNARLVKTKLLAFDFFGIPGTWLHTAHMEHWSICNRPHSLLWALSHSAHLSAEVFLGGAGKYVANGCTRKDWLKWWSSRRCRDTVQLLKKPSSALIRKLGLFLLQLPTKRSQRKTQKNKLRKKNLCPVPAGLL